MQLKITKEKPEIFSLEPSGCYLLETDTGVTRPIKESEMETAMNIPNRAVLRTPADGNAPRVLYLEHNVKDLETVKIWQASQHVSGGKLINQDYYWTRKSSTNPVRFERSYAGKVEFPTGVTIETGWQRV